MNHGREFVNNAAGKSAACMHAYVHAEYASEVYLRVALYEDEYYI